MKTESKNDASLLGSQTPCSPHAVMVAFSATICEGGRARKACLRVVFTLEQGCSIDFDCQSERKTRIAHVENLLLGCSHAFHAVHFNPVQPHLVATSNDKVHLGESLANVAVLVFTSLCKGWSWFVGLASAWLLLAPVWRCVEL